MRIKEDTTSTEILAQFADSVKKLLDDIDKELKFREESEKGRPDLERTKASYTIQHIKKWMLHRGNLGY